MDEKLKQLKEQQLNIKRWFVNNRWKINKIILKEWNETDPRWQVYLQQRQAKRIEYDHLSIEINKL